MQQNRILYISTRMKAKLEVWLWSTILCVETCMGLNLTASGLGFQHKMSRLSLGFIITFVLGNLLYSGTLSVKLTEST